MPHVELPGMGLVDFQFEKYPVDRKIKTLLMKKFNEQGVVGYSPVSEKWFFINNDILRTANPNEIELLPHLPENWEQLAVTS
jgi:hypothetical protein